MRPSLLLLVGLALAACGTDPTYPFFGFDVGSGQGVGGSDTVDVDAGDASTTDPDATAEDTAPSDSGAPDDTTPDDTTPDDTTPDDTTPGDTTPGDTTPDDTTPGDTTPGDTTPGDTTPGDTTPDIGPDAPTAGLCLNGADDLTLAFGGAALLDASVTCADECLLDAVCATGCIRDNADLSNGCAECFAEFGTCVGTSCARACLGEELTSRVCSTCLVLECEPEFDRCSGRGDLVPAPVEPEACVRASVRTLDFGPNADGTFTTRTLDIENCGVAGDPVVVVSRTRIEPPFGAAFELVGTPTFPVRLQPGQRLPLEVGYRPASSSDAALLVVESNAEPVNIAVSGSLALPGGPVIAGGCLANPADAPTTTTTASLPTSVACTAEGTTGATTYLWEWVSRPTGSDARILGPTRERAPLVLDRAGTYQVRLTATSTAGITATRTYTVTALAPETSGLVIALYWDTPSELDPFEETAFGDGADMDIHVRNTALGCWVTNPADCYYANTAPDWGIEGLTNDPRLLVDDTGGLGPEVIEIPTPEEFGYYQVAAQYYDPRVAGASSTPLFAVYSDGALLEFLELNALVEERSWNIAFDLVDGFSGWDVQRIDSVVFADPPVCAE